MPDGMYYNEAYSGHLIAMPQPLYGDDITLAAGGDASVEALSADVTAFLAWTSEPEMEVRKRTGIAAMVFLSSCVSCPTARCGISGLTLRKADPSLPAPELRNPAAAGFSAC